MRYAGSKTFIYIQYVHERGCVRELVFTYLENQTMECWRSESSRARLCVCVFCMHERAMPTFSLFECGCAAVLLPFKQATSRPTHLSELADIRTIWLVWNGVGVAGFDLFLKNQRLGVVEISLNLHIRNSW